MSKNRNLNILFTTDNGNDYYLDEWNSQYYFCHPMIKYLYNIIIIEKKDITFLEKTNYPITIGMGSFDKETTLYYYKKLIFLNKKGIFINRHKDLFYGNLQEKDITEAIANSEQLVIEMTQKCNLRCVYCAYGELYNRDPFRNTKDINITEVIRLIDYLYDNYWNTHINISKKRTICISFYGGEPLLRFGEIQEIVSYISTLKCNYVNFRFSITTNGVCINREIINFFIKYSFEVGISIDGNELNNSYRIFSNGKPSYTTVISNIEIIQKEFPIFFKKNVTFMSVLHNRNSVADIRKSLIEKYEKMTSIGNLNPDCIREDKIEKFHIMKNKHPKIELSYIKSDTDVMLRKLIEFYNRFIINSYCDLFYKPIKKRFPTGTCIPFKKKIFITANMALLPCEKIDFKNNFGLVDLKWGFDRLISETIKQHNKKLHIVKAQCSLCYKNWICDKCIYHFEKTNGKIKCTSFLSLVDFQNILGKCFSHLENKQITLTEILSDYE